jgi:Tfp pilus assembly protein PilV
MKINIMSHGDDRGETLIESLISIVLLGILGTALLNGMIVLTKSATLYDRQVSALNTQRAWAEYLSKNPPPGGCPSGTFTQSFPSVPTDSGTRTCVLVSGLPKWSLTVTSAFGGRIFTTPTPLDVVVVS